MVHISLKTTYFPIQNTLTFLIDALRPTEDVYNVDKVRYVQKKISTYSDINNFQNYRNTNITFSCSKNKKKHNIPTHSR